MAWTDQHTTLHEIQQALRTFNQERDWEQYHSPRNLAMALSVEAAELLELYLWSRDEGPQPPIKTREARVEEEVADVLVCLLNLGNRCGIDIAAAVERKIRKNDKELRSLLN